MSTVKSKKLQVGTDATSSNNFTIYQPATPDGTLRIGVGNADNPTEVGRFTNNGLSVTGRVQSTTQPAFFTSAEASQTNGGVSNGTHVISWTAAITDTTSSFDSTNNKYVAPVDGLYALNAVITWQTSGVSARYIRAFLTINGSIYAGNLTHISNETADADYTSATISCVANLSANDEVQIVWGTSTTSTVGIYNTTRATTFSGYLIG